MGARVRTTLVVRSFCARKCAAQVVRLVDLAYHVDDLVERGVLKSYAEAAAKLGITRARVSQVLQLMNLWAGIQEEILMGAIAPSERRLRSIAAIPDWSEQQARFNSPPSLSRSRNGG